MKAALLALIAVLSGEPAGQDVFLPVSLLCPAENAGTLAVVAQNRSGRRERYQVTLEAGAVVYAALGRAEPGGDFHDVLVVTSSAMATYGPDGGVEVELAGENSERAAADLLATARALGGEACEASADARLRQAEILAENRRSLGLE